MKLGTEAPAVGRDGSGGDHSGDGGFGLLGGLGLVDCGSARSADENFRLLWMDDDYTRFGWHGGGGVWGRMPGRAIGGRQGEDGAVEDGFHGSITGF